MERSGDHFAGSRQGPDGSGQIENTFDDGRRLDCPIGYVTNRDEEPHRYVIRDGQCTRA